MPTRGALRLLEVGCGDATLLRYALLRNPELTALAVELDPAVAERARANLAEWGLSKRAEVSRATCARSARAPTSTC